MEELITLRHLDLNNCDHLDWVPHEFTEKPDFSDRGIIERGRQQWCLHVKRSHKFFKFDVIVKRGTELDE